MNKQIKVGIVEDQRLFREGMRSILNGWYDTRLMFESPDGYSLLDRLREAENVPEVMLVDLTLPMHNHEEYNGWRVVRDLKENYPQIKILILSVHQDPYLIAQLIKEGADGYLLKDGDAEEVHEAIATVTSRGSYINEHTLKAIQGKLGGKIRAPKTHDDLTRREVEVLKLVCQQMTTSEIAEHLFISEKTVNGHRNNLLQKTGSRNVTGLVMYAVKHRLIDFV
ncbi:response regulator transcription factor [bacterium SCSIO 12741]|nr:response regulator transcription factor [bacterium SCSIO 12741]